MNSVSGREVRSYKFQASGLRLLLGERVLCFSRVTCNPGLLSAMRCEMLLQPDLPQTTLGLLVHAFDCISLLWFGCGSALLLVERL